MIKSSNNTSSWYIMDSQRDDFDKYSNTETSSAETSNNIINTTSTGFEFTGSGLNNSNYDWIYMAFK